MSEIPPISEHATDPIASKDSYAIGYGRPPENTRFEPGRSGNPKGRPKERQNLMKAIRQVYTDKIPVREGEKTVRSERIVALIRKLVNQALMGDVRANLAAYKIAKECGALDETKMDKISDYIAALHDQYVDDLTDAELAELIRLTKKSLGRNEQT